MRVLPSTLAGLVQRSTVGDSLCARKILCFCLCQCVGRGSGAVSGAWPLRPVSRV